MKVLAAIELLLALMDRATAVSDLIKGAIADGRDELTAEEWDQIKAADDTARAELEAALQRARDAGR